MAKVYDAGTVLSGRRFERKRTSQQTTHYGKSSGCRTIFLRFVILVELYLYFAWCGFLEFHAMRRPHKMEYGNGLSRQRPGQWGVY
jgi:hypothetical protein